MQSSPDAETAESGVTSDERNYESDAVKIHIDQIQTGAGSDQITYYVADMQVKDAQVLQSAFAEDSFGRNITQITYRDPLGHDPSSGSGIRRGKARNGSYRAGVGAAGERRGAYAAVHVVVDLFETETAAYADWLLPGTSFLEVEGTMTNLEGRVFYRPRVFEPAGAAMPDAWLLCALAERLGRGRYFSYSSMSEVFDELCRASAGGKADYSGISYSRLQEAQGLFWPCPASA
ncbi:molybdopterin-dependent oxidoreductase [Paenibacillus barengoltzii]|uniref:molybdopterin-dependent oxidoreductase n=1 Tax=Paenibacillus barengoltzii TaxID=343517 RepID=UPI002DB9DD27|nr:molybdopterin-dependent oxidoreductase [Paenibacillus barengoltzii]MEC2342938.1 molybdopterin-dependent oxidoreductase [Paenibacillus barengoltzii]